MDSQAEISADSPTSHNAVSLESLSITASPTQKSRSLLKSSITQLLDKTPIVDLLQYHVQIFTVNEKIPAAVCFKGMAEYRHTFALVYGEDRGRITGLLDELAFIRMLQNEDLEAADQECSEFLKRWSNKSVNEPQSENQCQQPFIIDEDATATKALELFIKRGDVYVFVWSKKRNAAIGYFTCACICGFICRKLQGSLDAVNVPLNYIRAAVTPRISATAQFREALKQLVLFRQVAVEAQGSIIGFVCRRKLLQYLFEVIRCNGIVRFSEPIRSIVEWRGVDIEPFYKVPESTSLSTAMSQLLLSQDRALVIQRGVNFTLEKSMVGENNKVQEQQESQEGIIQVIDVLLFLGGV
ncbi:CBS domain superfamily [Babesia duncani]|uniref:CBS domain superfamily n=1 Tax=Babesia duncani TaxID=323732 RepID=A0AAD9PJU2_9APIC|nr:CBS domain superfamily [Babesia duncani]